MNLNPTDKRKRRKNHLWKKIELTMCTPFSSRLTHLNFFYSFERLPQYSNFSLPPEFVVVVHPFIIEISLPIINLSQSYLCLFVSFFFFPVDGFSETTEEDKKSPYYDKYNKSVQSCSYEFPSGSQSFMFEYFFIKILLKLFQGHFR